MLATSYHSQPKPDLTQEYNLQHCIITDCSRIQFFRPVWKFSCKNTCNPNLLGIYLGCRKILLFWNEKLIKKVIIQEHWTMHTIVTAKLLILKRNWNDFLKPEVWHFISNTYSCLHSTLTCTLVSNIHDRHLTTGNKNIMQTAVYRTTNLNLNVKIQECPRKNMKRWTTFQTD